MTSPPTSWCVVESDLGLFVVAGTTTHVTSVSLPTVGHVPSSSASSSAPVHEGARQLESFLAGSRRTFSLPLETSGTPFQRSVWHAMARIPWGETWSYGQLADAIGRPASARPVGQAVARNPLPLIWPCHRVVASDGLGGYGGGLDLKVALLAREGVEFRSATGEASEHPPRSPLP